MAGKLTIVAKALAKGSSQNTMHITVQTLKGQSCSLECTHTLSVDGLKDLVHKKIPSISRDSQRLILRGKLLKTDFTSVKEAGIKDGGKLTIIN
jgi:hypothetical protein